MGGSVLLLNLVRGTSMSPLRELDVFPLFYWEEVNSVDSHPGNQKGELLCQQSERERPSPRESPPHE